MPSDRREPATVPNADKIAERLRAHARLCRHIAEESWSEDTAQELDRLADECMRAAAALEPEDNTSRVLPRFRSSD